MLRIFAKEMLRLANSNGENEEGERDERRRKKEGEEEENEKLIVLVRRTGRRRFHNEAELEQVLHHGLLSLSPPPHRLTFLSVDFSTLSFREQMIVSSKARVMIGMHGAGLTNAIYMNPPQAALVEIFPFNYSRNTYEALSKLSNISYIPIKIAKDKSIPHKTCRNQFADRRNACFRDQDTIVDPVEVLLAIEQAINQHV